MILIRAVNRNPVGAWVRPDKNPIAAELATEITMTINAAVEEVELRRKRSREHRKHREHHDHHHEYHDNANSSGSASSRSSTSGSNAPGTPKHHHYDPDIARSSSGSMPYM